MGIADRDYMRERYRQRRGLPPARHHWGQSGKASWGITKKERRSGIIAAGIAAVLIATTIGARGWLSDQFVARILSETPSFPASGTVSVPANIDMKRVVAKLTVQGGPENAIVQMIDATSDRNALSIYVRAHERITVPVPIGRFRMRLVHGREWTDSRSLFGKGTLHDEIAGVMRFSRTIGHVLDLRLGEDSNLVMRRIALPPAPLA